MKDSNYEDGGWLDPEEGCLECGELKFRESQIPGVCEECASETLSPRRVLGSRVVGANQV